MLTSPGATQPIHPERESLVFFGEKQANSASLIRRIPRLDPDTEHQFPWESDFNKVPAKLKLDFRFSNLTKVLLIWFPAILQVNKQSRV